MIQVTHLFSPICSTMMDATTRTTPTTCQGLMISSRKKKAITAAAMGCRVAVMLAWVDRIKRRPLL